MKPRLNSSVYTKEDVARWLERRWKNTEQNQVRQLRIAGGYFKYHVLIAPVIKEVLEDLIADLDIKEVA